MALNAQPLSFCEESGEENGFFDAKEYDLYSVYGCTASRLMRKSIKATKATIIVPKVLKTLTDEDLGEFAAYEVTQRSELTVSEHKRYLEVVESRRRARQTGFPIQLALDDEARKDYDALKLRVYEERDQYTRAVVSLVKKGLEKIPILPEKLFNEMTKWNQERITSAIESYPSDYTMALSLNLKHIEEQNEEQTLQFEAHTAKKDKPSEPVALETLKDHILNVSDYKCLSMDENPVSKDPILRKLMKKHKIRIAFSEEALVTMFMNQSPSFDEAWLVPLLKTKANEVFFDSPVVNQLISKRQQYQQVCQALCEEKLGSSSERTFKYDIWQLGDDRVLIRYEKDLPLVTFVDYNIQNRTDAISATEAATWWLKGYLRQRAQVLIGHVVVVGDTCRLKEVQSAALEDILNYGPEFIDAGVLFKVVAEVIRTAMDLPDGYSIAQHTAGSHDVVFSHETKENQDIINLSRLLENAGRLDTELDCRVPKWNNSWIRYTFRPGSFCTLFFKTGVCPYISRGDRCTAIHISPPSGDPFSFPVYKTESGATVSLQPIPHEIRVADRFCIVYAYNGACHTTSCSHPHKSLATILYSIVEKELLKRKNRRVFKRRRSKSQLATSTDVN